MPIEALSDIRRTATSAFTTTSQTNPAQMARIGVSIVPAAYGLAEVRVQDARAVVGTVVMCQLVPTTDWEADELFGFTVTGQVGVAGVDEGSITFAISCDGPIVGNFEIAYLLGTP